MIALTHRPIELALRHRFRIARGASDTRLNVALELTDSGCPGLVGRGEAAPIRRYRQNAESVARALDQMAARLGDPRRFATAAASAAVAGQPAAEAAVDMALHDLAGQRFGVPLYEVFGLDPRAAPPTSFTIGMDTPEVVAAKVREAGDFEILKIKLGSADDLALLEAVRAETDRPLRVDANEGWTLERAKELVEQLAAMGVELIEQPLPADRLAETRELRRASPLPLIADESVGRAADIPLLAEAFDGINIKLAKCGGLAEARRMVAVARAHGLKVMLGCMIESSLGITAAAHLSPLVDFADLDGSLLVRNDPFVGATLAGGRLVPPEAPGLGVEPRAGSEKEAAG